jgi:transcriptional regulator with XRE-family HTH domain
LRQGFTQQKVADRAGIEYKYFQNIEAGRWPNLTLATVQKISDALKVKPWELICDPPAAEKNLRAESGESGARAERSSEPRSIGTFTLARRLRSSQVGSVAESVAG